MRISDWSSDVCSSDLRNKDIWLPEPEERQLHPSKQDQIGEKRRRNGPDEDRKDRQSLRKRDRKSVVSGKSVSVRVDLGGRRISKKQKSHETGKRGRESKQHYDVSELKQKKNTK